MKTVAQKMHIKAGNRAHLHHAPQHVLDSMGLPELECVGSLTGEFDYLHLFTTTQAELNDLFPTFKAHLKPGGTLWISWPKGRQGGTDLTLPEVIRIGYSHGLVESTTLSVDSHWSAIKFTHPKEGKTYHNSYGKLPDQP